MFNEQSLFPKSLSNRALILKYIQHSGPVSKRQIEKEIDLSWATVSEYITELCEKKLIIESGVVMAGTRNVSTAYVVNPVHYYSIGIQFDVDSITAVVVNLKLEVVKTLNYTIEDRVIGNVLKLGKELIHAIIREFIENAHFIGIGISFLGYIDKKSGASIISSEYQSFSPVEIANYYQTEFNLPVTVEHEPNCQALAEQLIGNKIKEENYLFFNLSPNINMALVFDKKIYHGFGPVNGFAHIVVAPNGPRCDVCGSRGCLHLFASKQSIKKHVREAIKYKETLQSTNQFFQKNSITLKSITEAARSGDQSIYCLLSQAAKYAAIGIVNAINLISPQAIVLRGDLVDIDFCLNIIIKEIHSRILYADKLTIYLSNLDMNLAAQGAAYIALNENFIDTL